MYWARLRIFSNGKTDILFENEDKLHGFETEEFAGYFLSADEFIRFEGLDEDELRSLEVPEGIEIETPDWENREARNFDYIGKY